MSEDRSSEHYPFSCARVCRCLLALAIALVQSSGTPVDAVYIFLIMIAYCVFLYVAVRPALE